jgi:hypothetical protein
VTRARRARRKTSLVALGMLATFAAGPALGWGPVGHRIAGDLAEQKLCPSARTKVKSLGGGESLAELGSWADEIRDEPKWQSSRPWHYMDLADLPPGAGLAEARAAIDKHAHPREGDVLEALARFSKVLADPKRRAMSAPRRCASSCTSSSTSTSRCTSAARRTMAATTCTSSSARGAR